MLVWGKILSLRSEEGTEGLMESWTPLNHMHNMYMDFVFFLGKGTGAVILFPRE